MIAASPWAALVPLIVIAVAFVVFCLVLVVWGATRLADSREL